MLLVCATSSTASGCDGGGGGGSGGSGGPSKTGGVCAGVDNTTSTTGATSVASTAHHLLLPRKTSAGLNVTHGAVVNLILGPPPGSSVSALTSRIHSRY